MKQMRGKEQDAGPDTRSSALALCSYNAPCSHSYGPHGKIVTNCHLSISVGQIMHGLLSRVVADRPFSRAFWVALGTGDADFDNRVCDERKRLEISTPAGSYILQRISLPAGCYAAFKVFCNDVLSPLLHMDERVCRGHSAFLNTAALPSWESFVQVNRDLAAGVGSCLNGYIRKVLQVHDFECCLVAAMVRNRLPALEAAYFGHIAWPPADFFRRLPSQEMRRQILAGILANDKIYFHTARFAENFIECVSLDLLSGETRVAPPYVTYHGRRSKISVNPLGVDCPKVVAAVLSENRRGLPPLERRAGGLLCVWAERSDFTKGTFERLQAIRQCFKAHPEIIARVEFIQVLCPSRQYLHSYKQLYQEIIKATELLNRDFSTDGLKLRTIAPLPWEALMKLFAAADIMWVNSLNDGLALTAKEYVATHLVRRSPGVLMLSRFAGASVELKEALLLDPFDAADAAAKLYQAVTMPEQERIARMEALSRTVEQNDFARSIAGLMP